MRKTTTSRRPMRTTEVPMLRLFVRAVVEMASSSMPWRKTDRSESIEVSSRAFVCGWLVCDHRGRALTTSVVSVYVAEMDDDDELLGMESVTPIALCWRATWTDVRNDVERRYGFPGAFIPSTCTQAMVLKLHETCNEKECGVEVLEDEFPPAPLEIVLQLFLTSPCTYVGLFASHYHGITALALAASSIQLRMRDELTVRLTLRCVRFGSRRLCPCNAVAFR
jgi:hypothetical protein